MQGKFSRVALCTLAALILLFSGAALKAQVASGAIVGTVTDPSGAVIPGATVTARDTGTGIVRTVKTNATGNYTFSVLQVGNYVITVQASGFATFASPALSLSVGQHLRVDAKLQVGQASQTVSISASAVPLLETQTSTIGSTLTPTQVENLPLNGRNFINLARMAPGVDAGSPVALSSGTRPDDRRQSSTVSAGGQPDLVNDYLIDGVDNNERIIGTIGVRPSIDAIQEVQVLTNLYTAKYGRTAGAVVNVITKAGTNRFHGSLFEFARNGVFDAKSYFNNPVAGNALAGKQPPFTQNQYGGSLGGPIRKNKTFFFADYEGLRLSQGLTSQTTVPSPCELGAVACGGVQQIGNFSDLLPGFPAGRSLEPKPSVAQEAVPSLGLTLLHHQIIVSPMDTAAAKRPSMPLYPQCPLGRGSEPVVASTARKDFGAFRPEYR